MRQLRLVSGVTPARFQSTHPVWDATSRTRFSAWSRVISIHASRMGCDLRVRLRSSRWHFNPRIPYGMRPQTNDKVTIAFQFQSTHPVWDATRLCPSGRQLAHFNPRIPYGMRLSSSSALSRNTLFQSTHPVWDATPDVVIKTDPNKFQSTHPVWDATFRKVIVLVARQFQSTHPVWDATLLLVH